MTHLDPGEVLKSHRSEPTGRASTIRQALRTPTERLQEYSVPLIVGVFAGLLLANLDANLYEDLVDYHLFGDGAKVFGRAVTVEFIINEIFMVFFFGIAAKEITASALPGGALNPVSKAINPLVGTLGGVVGPAGLFFLLTFVFFGGTDDFSVVAKGWGIPTATDIALAWLVARSVFGKSHPAVNFLLLLAIADDAIGLGIIAIFYPDPDLPVTPVWLLLTAGGMGVAFGMRRMKIRSWIPYIAVAGAMSWVGLAKSAIEPALALVVIVPFLPGPEGHQEGALKVEHGEMGSAGHAAAAVSGNPLDQFEHQIKLFVDIGLFFFAFANAGVTFGSINEVTAIVLLSLIAGKTIGISLFSIVAMRAGFPLPTGMQVKHLLVASLIAGLGLTVALFVAEKAFPGPPFDEPAKMGAVLSGGVAFLAFVVGALLRVKDAPGDGEES